MAVGSSGQAGGNITINDAAGNVNASVIDTSGTSAAGGHASVAGVDIALNNYIHTFGGGYTTLNGSGSVTQSAPIITGSLELLGGGDFVLGDTSNSFRYLAGNVGSLDITSSFTITTNTVGSTSNLIASGTGGIALRTSHANGIITTSSVGSITASAGPVTLMANAIDISGTATVTSAGTITVMPYTAATTIGLGTGSGTLKINTTQLGRLNASNVVIGSTAGTGAVTAAGALSAPSGGNLSILTGGTLTINSGATLSTSGGGNLTIADNVFVNNAAASALSAAGGGRWLVYSQNPASDTRGALVYAFKEYNKAYGSAPTPAAGNGFLYTVAPTVTASLIGTVTKTYDGNTTATLTAGNYSLTSGIDGDTVTLNNPSTGSYADKNAGTGKNVSVSGLAVSGTNGAVTVYGYTLTSSTANANIGEITALPITVTAQTNTKTYDSTTSAAALPIITSGALQGSDTASFSEIYDTANVGTGKTLTPSGTINDGNGGNNYTITFVNDTTGVINAAALTISAVTDTKTYDGTTSSSAPPTVTGTLFGSDTVTGATQAFVSQNVLGLNGSTLQVTGYTVNDGNGGANYIVNSSGTASGTINAASLTISAVTDTKTYDGTTSSSALPTITGTLFGSDTVTGATQAFASQECPGSQRLDAAGDGLHRQRWQWRRQLHCQFERHSRLGTINTAALTISAVTDTKTYDGTTSSSALPTITGTLFGSDTVTGATQAFASQNVLGLNGSTLQVTGYTVNDGNGGGQLHRQFERHGVGNDQRGVANDLGGHRHQDL